MKTIHWKTAALTSLLCLLPILLGLSVYQSLPEQIAIHFNINNQPDNFAPRAFAVFGLPILTALLQLLSCILTDLKAANQPPAPKLAFVTRAIIPVITLAVYVTMIAFALGQPVDVRRVICLLLGGLFIAVGNYLPKAQGAAYINLPQSVKGSPVLLRRFGIAYVIFGLLFCVSVLLPAWSSAAVLAAMLLTIAVFSIIGIKDAKK